MPTVLPFRATRLSRLLPALVAALLAWPVGGAEPASAPAAGRWIDFEATWSAAGQRQALRAGNSEAATTHLSGAFTVLNGQGLRKGFRGEALFYSDGREVGAGTLVLTDDRGDQVFCSLVGDATKGGTEIRASIRGGTGAYSGISGRFAFLWRHLVKTPEGGVQGVAQKVGGRYRLPAGAPPAVPGVQR
jgi:hypothetical protein